MKLKLFIATATTLIASYTANAEVDLLLTGAQLFRQ